MLPTAERLHKAEASTGDKACLLELPCAWLWPDKARRVVTRIRSYDTHRSDFEPPGGVSGWGSQAQEVLPPDVHALPSVPVSALWNFA
jgi:hypothetical protein